MFRIVKKWILDVVNWFWAQSCPEWTDAQVKEFFDQFSNHFELANYLAANKFTWNSDGMNILPVHALDTYERPSQLLARKFGNCTGYLRLFSEFIKYKRCADSMEEYLMHNGEIGSWHAIIVIQSNGIVYYQSNMNVNIMDKPLNELFPQYRIRELTDFWKRS